MVLSRIKLCILSLSTIFASTQASANPAVISALMSTALSQETQDMQFEDQKQTACMALAVYHEAANQSERGQRAVVHVILNRVASSRFATTPCGVVFQRGQFSFIHYGMARLIPHGDPRWNPIVKLVRSVTAGIDDPTSGALYFYNPRNSRPGWRNVKSTVRIGAHVFVRA